MVQDRVAEKYLKNYGEPIATVAARFPDETYGAAVVAPIYGEEASTFVRLSNSDGKDGKNLLILVVNAPIDAPPQRVQMNDAFLKVVRQSGDSKLLDAGVELVSHAKRLPRTDVLLLDATQEPFRLRAKEGVGRARKMGLDVALALHLRGHIVSPMCGSTDADVTLPQGYFAALNDKSATLKHAFTQYSGLLFPYRHLLPEAGTLRDVMMQLETSFRYYVLGLHHARSPYAFHTLGSAIGVNLAHYARVRGVPNRQAGEDFHLLAKLSKLAPLARMSGPTIEIATRISDRVPFGTGPSLSKALTSPHERVLLYHPHAFDWLREVLEVLTQAADARSEDELEFSTELPEWAQRRAHEVYRSALPHLAACPTASHRLRKLHERFDALATIRFIHEAHRNGLCRLEVEAAFELSPFLPSRLKLEEKLRYCAETELSVDSPAGIVPTYRSRPAPKI